MQKPNFESQLVIWIVITKWAPHLFALTIFRFDIPQAPFAENVRAMGELHRLVEFCIVDDATDSALGRNFLVHKSFD